MGVVTNKYLNAFIDLSEEFQKNVTEIFWKIELPVFKITTAIANSK